MKNVTANNRRIIFINRYFYPDHSATSQILSDLAFYLSSQGFNVEIVTSRQKYDNADAILKKVDDINGVRVNRIKTTRFGRKNLIGRSIDYLSFYISAVFYLLFNLHKDDVVVAKTDPPLISIVAALMCRLKRASLINWTQDLFPEVAKSLGIKGLSSIYPLLIAMRNYSLRAACKNVVIGETMSQRLQDYGIDKNKIMVIHNWSIEDNIVPLSPSDNPFREKWELQGKFIVGYSGNIGRAHDINTLLGAANFLRDDQNIVFVIIGGGALYDEFKNQAESLDLKNVMFQPYQEKEILPYSLTLPDLHVISLQPELEGLIVPSKFYGIIASGRPVLYIGDTAGEIPGILLANDCGKSVNIDDIDSAVNFIKQLQAEPILSVKLGERSRRLFDERFCRQHSLESWARVLSSSNK